MTEKTDNLLSNPLDDLFVNLPENRNELFAYHQQLTQKAIELMRKKNLDYGATNDPFANFRKRGALGIMVRLEDKLARLDSFLEKGGLALKSESIEDTVVDGINYLVLLYAFLKSEGAI